GRFQLRSKPGFELLLEGFDGPAMAKEEEFQASPLAILSENSAVAKDLGNPLKNRNDLVGAYEGVESRGEKGVCRKAAAYPQREPDLIPAPDSAADRGEANIVDFCIATPGTAARDANLEFAGKVVEIGIADEELVGFESEGRRIE